MKTTMIRAAAVAVALGWMGVPQVALAQEADEDTGPRVIYVSTFNLPYGEDRGTVLSWMREWFWPAGQLNPNVINRRMVFHLHGSQGAQVMTITEYPSMEAFAAGCGQPCTEYQEANPAPEEGDEGWEEYNEGLQLFLKYFSDHKDEIYSSPMGWAKVEGETVGPIGASPEEDDG